MIKWCPKQRPFTSGGFKVFIIGPDWAQFLTECLNPFLGRKILKFVKAFDNFDSIKIILTPLIFSWKQHLWNRIRHSKAELDTKKCHTSKVEKKKEGNIENIKDSVTVWCCRDKQVK